MVKTISVVVCCQSRTSTASVKDALFSIASQYYADVQIVLVCQGLGEKTLFELRDFLTNLPFEKTRSVVIASRPARQSQHLILNIQSSRPLASLLKEGIKCCVGRYLAFLNSNDIVYPHAYASLIRALSKSRSSISVGGTVRSYLLTGSLKPYVLSKEFFIDRDCTLSDLLVHNYLPIHSVVIDTTRIEKKRPLIDAGLSAFEGHSLLLKLLVRHRSDFSLIDSPVCELRIPHREFMSSASGIGRRRGAKEASRVIAALESELGRSLSGLTLNHLLSAKDLLAH